MVLCHATFPSSCFVRLTFFGAAQEVTGSMFVLELDAGTLLIDCGLVQGRRAESRQRNRVLPAAVTAADAAILTHAHLGRAPLIPDRATNPLGPSRRERRDQLDARWRGLYKLRVDVSAPPDCTRGCMIFAAPDRERK